MAEAGGDGSSYSRPHPECRYFAQGFCYRGQDCPFAHDSRSLLVCNLNLNSTLEPAPHPDSEPALFPDSFPDQNVFGLPRTSRPPNPVNEESQNVESLKRHHYLNSFSSSDNTSAIYGINQFSYLLPEEFKDIYLRSKPSGLPLYSEALKMPTTYMPLPVRFDWRDKHVVTKVRNQQMCGGCWAFSVVGSIESAYAIKGESLEDLSVQQVIDCSYNNFGCSGGSTVNALNWLNKTQVRLVKDSEYSFKAQTGLCHYFSGSHAGVSIKGYSSYDFSGEENEMARVLLTYGPLAVIVDAVSWQDYLGGIIQHHCSSGEANHAVLITGFDRTGNTPYWIVRNSWGPSWGVDGYAFVKMGANVCGIADLVSAVFV
ncbi:cathepsin O [Gracilinanus agilis]|uniref:cathepsin O n=1 Tax=Gracilinanus agilis TaxID=191870 RepID=UPI001CFE4197|nr:cathepsin O [Gracilinanus agilis]